MSYPNGEYTEDEFKDWFAGMLSQQSGVAQRVLRTLVDSRWGITPYAKRRAIVERVAKALRAELDVGT